MNEGNSIVRMNIIPFSLKFHQTNCEETRSNTMRRRWHGFLDTDSAKSAENDMASLTVRREGI